MEIKQENGLGYPPWINEKVKDSLLSPSLPTATNTDFSFDGMTGGDVIHEMIIRHRVDHLCMRSKTKAGVQDNS